MKLRMAENSLFAILLRKDWWVSAAIAVALIAFAATALPPAWFPFGATLALPFLVIAGIVGRRALQAPSAARIAAVEAAARAMGANEFATAVEDAWRDEGWTVTRLSEAGADFHATRGWKRAVVSCRRAKAARVGVEPLRELHAAIERHEAHEGVCVALGEVSEQARRFAASNRIRILAGPDLAVAMRSLGRTSRPGGGRPSGRPTA
jgi:restriction system protein